MAKLVEILARDMKSWEWGDYAVQRDDALVMFFNEGDGSGQPVNASWRYEKAHPHHRTATREQWQAARDALNKPAAPVIDWSKAPEGATHFHPLSGYWYRLEGTVWQCFDQKARRWVTALWIGYILPMCVARPELSAPAWDGTGLPPVGTNVEVIGLGDEYLPKTIEDWKDGDKVECVAHHAMQGDHVRPVFFNKRTVQFSPLREDCYRPIRTPEKIAAEERGKALELMVAQIEVFLGSIDKVSPEMLIGAVYDLGYRKHEPK